jgi:hypothetical protein
MIITPDVNGIIVRKKHIRVAYVQDRVIFQLIHQGTLHKGRAKLVLQGKTPLVGIIIGIPSRKFSKDISNN